MTNCQITTPKRLITGTDSVKILPSLLKEMGIGCAFVVFDPKVMESAFGAQILKLLEPPNFDFFSDFGTNPTVGHVQKALMLFDNERHQGIIAIGGGSAIDLGKVIGLISANGGCVEEYFQGHKANNPTKPIVAIPTTCGTGAESSPFAVIMDPSGPRKRGIESPLLMPTAVILDPNALSSLSRELIAATAIDAFAHILESHISNKATTHTRIVSRGLLYCIRDPLEKAIFDRDIVALASMQSIAFTARLLYPRTGLSIAHALSHPLGAYTNMHHGLAVATFFEMSMKYNVQACRIAFDEAEKAMGFINISSNMLSWIYSIILKSGIKDAITDILSNSIISVGTIAADALNSSNINTNPMPIGFDETVQIVNDSLDRFRG